MDILSAKEAVVKAGKELVKSGLIARTWGNVSCRIDENTFAITPSGMAYETLTPDDIVVVKIEDLSYDGNIKPSSEKGIHASCYRLRPETNFVIHTHQKNASIVSALGMDINNVEGQAASLIGDNIPVAAYGLSGTPMLKNAVCKALKRSQSRAVIMKHHGAVCLGKDYDDAFKIASELENVCQDVIFAKYSEKTGAIAESFADVYDYVVDLKKRANAAPKITPFDSTRSGNIVTLNDKSGERKAVIGLKNEDLILGEKIPSEADMHMEIYRKRADVKAIIHSDEEATVAASKIIKKSMRPLIDDCAQIAGVILKSVTFDPNNTEKTKKNVSKALGKHKTVALLKDNGAVCVGKDVSEAEAAEIVCEKNCKSFVSAQMFKKAKPVGLVSSVLENVVYRMKYSKIKK